MCPNCDGLENEPNALHAGEGSLTYSDCKDRKISVSWKLNP